jgi:hypothetical protein
MQRIASLWYWSQSVTQRCAVTRWLHLPQLSARFLRRLVRPSVPNFAFQWLPRRGGSAVLPETLQKQFADVSSVWAIWPTGEGFFEIAENAHIVKRLILPNPERKHVKYYFDFLDKSEATDLIKIITLRARRLGAEVRWTDHFIFNSITLADHDQVMGWAQIESVVDSISSSISGRVGYLLFKDRAPIQVNMLVEFFLKSWRDAKEPSL